MCRISRTDIQYCSFGYFQSGSHRNDRDVSDEIETILAKYSCGIGGEVSSVVIGSSSVKEVVTKLNRNGAAVVGGNMMIGIVAVDIARSR